MSFQSKGLHSYHYPEVTNILMGQSPFTLMHNTSTSANLEFHAKGLNAFKEISIRAFADGPSGNGSDTTVACHTNHGLETGDYIELTNTTNYNTSGTPIKITDASNDSFTITTNYTPESPGDTSAVTLTSTTGHTYVAVDSWCALKVASWDSTGQLVGTKLQARCIEGFPGDDFAIDGTYDGTTESNNVQLVAGDIITGVFDKVAILAPHATTGASIMASKLNL